jgi:hypothetical protein
MDTYGHLFPDSEDLSRGAIDDALAAAQAEQGRNSDAGKCATAGQHQGGGRVGL